MKLTEGLSKWFSDKMRSLFSVNEYKIRKSWFELLAIDLRTSDKRPSKEFARLINKREYLLRYELGYPATHKNYRLIALAQNGDFSLNEFTSEADQFPTSSFLDDEKSFTQYANTITCDSPRELEDILALMNLPTTTRGKEIVRKWRLCLIGYSSMISELYDITSTVYFTNPEEV